MGLRGYERKEFLFPSFFFEISYIRQCMYAPSIFSLIHSFFYLNHIVPYLPKQNQKRQKKIRISDQGGKKGLVTAQVARGEGKKIKEESKTNL